MKTFLTSTSKVKLNSQFGPSVAEKNHHILKYSFDNSIDIFFKNDCVVRSDILVFSRLSKRYEMPHFYDISMDFKCVIKWLT